MPATVSMTSSHIILLSDWVTISNDAPYIHPTKPYEFSNLASDLVVLARYMLKPGGRLVFFLPTVTDEYDQLDIDSTLCEGMTVVANSLQDFGSWGRRVCPLEISHKFNGSLMGT
jgi:tRNA (guanine10-N2)-methyltransferase